MKSQQWRPECGASWREEDAGIHPGERPPPRPAGRFLGFKFRRRWSELEQTFSGAGTRGRYDVTAAEAAADGPSARPRVLRMDSAEPASVGLPLLCGDLLAGGCARRLLRGFVPNTAADIPVAAPTSTLASEDSGGCRLTAVPVRKRYADIKAAASAADATMRPRPRGRYTKLSEGYRNKVTTPATLPDEKLGIHIDVNMNYVPGDCTTYLTPTKSIEDMEVPDPSVSDQDDNGTYGRTATVSLRRRRASLPLRAGLMTASEFLERRMPTQSDAPASPASQRSAPFLSTFSASPEAAATPSPAPPARRASLPARPLSEITPKNLAEIQRMRAVSEELHSMPALRHVRKKPALALNLFAPFAHLMDMNNTWTRSTG